MNRHSPLLSRLLYHLRGVVSLDDTEVNRRDLSCARQSEVQLELDLMSPHKANQWSAYNPKRSSESLQVTFSAHPKGFRKK